MKLKDLLLCVALLFAIGFGFLYSPWCLLTPAIPLPSGTMLITRDGALEMRHPRDQRLLRSGPMMPTAQWRAVVAERERKIIIYGRSRREMKRQEAERMASSRERRERRLRDEYVNGRPR